MELAIFNDCIKLIDNFVHKSKSGFRSFCEEWSLMVFRHIYSAQSSVIELMQTTTTIFYISNCLASSNTYGYNFQHNHEKILRRIGAIYLMYTIYYKQPTKEYIKIDMSPETWKNISTFINQLPEDDEQYDDVRYMFWNLYKDKAIHFTGLQYNLGLENLVEYDQLLNGDNKLIGEIQMETQIPGFAEQKKQLHALTILEDGYNEMKELLHKSNKKNVKSQSLPQTTIFKDIQQTFQNIEKLLTSKKNMSKKKNIHLTKYSKRDIKRKAYKVYHTNKDIEIDNTEQKDENAASRNLRRMSVRTIFTEPLPNDILMDLNEDVDKQTGSNEEIKELSNNELELEFQDLIAESLEENNNDEIY